MNKFICKNLHNGKVNKHWLFPAEQIRPTNLECMYKTFFN